MTGEDGWKLTLTWDPKYREHRYQWVRGALIVLEGYVAGSNTAKGREDAKREAHAARREYERRAA